MAHSTLDSSDEIAFVSLFLWPGNIWILQISTAWNCGPLRIFVITRKLKGNEANESI